MDNPTFNNAAPWILFGVLIIITLLNQIQTRIGSQVAKELDDLFLRRVARMRAALAPSSDHNWNTPPIRSYPFETWVQLTDRGITVSGQTFQATEPFQVLAKDDRHICRAAVRCDGRGGVRITSHGQEFYARYQDRRWTVERIPNSHAGTTRNSSTTLRVCRR